MLSSKFVITFTIYKSLKLLRIQSKLSALIWAIDTKSITDAIQVVTWCGRFLALWI